MTFSLLLTGILENSSIAKLAYTGAVTIAETKKKLSLLSQCISLYRLPTEIIGTMQTGIGQIAGGNSQRTAHLILAQIPQTKKPRSK